MVSTHSGVEVTKKDEVFSVWRGGQSWGIGTNKDDRAIRGLESESQ